ncbi:MAG TPA: response regulator [Gemmatimonadaceae bacterium]|nr:response regulator [Gemmatimonadaceae bacterium]
MNKAQLAERLFATFLDELDEQLRVLNAELLLLERDPTDADRLRSIFRVVHTLKGAARAVNVPAVEQACHGLETLLAAVRAELRHFGEEEFVLLFRAADALADAGRRLRGGGDVDDSPIALLAAELVEEGVVASGGRAAAVGVPPAPRSTEATRGLDSSVADPPTPAAETTGERTEGALRVRSDKLDALFAGMGSLSVTSGRIVGRTGELADLDRAVSEALTQWRRSARRLRRGAQHAIDAGAVAAIAEAEQTLDRLARQVGRLATAGARDAATLEQGTHDVSERVRQLRMRPFADACEALPRVARDVAAASGKDVQLRLLGGEVEADRTVLDGLREALLQLVRNAVDHGIEQPGVREQRGKAAQGTVVVSAALRGDRLIVTVADDGAGIDETRMRDSLARAGRPVGHEPLALADALVAGGVSTRTEASTFSGRGVGIDVARAAVARLGGRLDVSWTNGGGTTFVLETPLTVARIRAVLASAGGQVLALPTTHVEYLVRLPHSSIRRVEGREMFSVAAVDSPELVPLVSLARLLGPPLVDKPAADPAVVILLAVAGERLGVTVDELRGEQELFVRALPGKRAISAHLSGAAMLSSGGVALLLDAASLIATARGMTGAGLTIPGDHAGAVRRSTVLVVDDSLTTRTLERGVLEAAGYLVKTAVDGADGWRVIDEEGCDLVVADVEMPRMDGLALCEAIRASERHRSLPVILVTALESPEHRARGLAVGADAYIGKSSFDQTNLLDTVAQLLDPETA